jgi:hypothetical protein
MLIFNVSFVDKIFGGKHGTAFDTRGCKRIIANQSSDGL